MAALLFLPWVVWILLRKKESAGRLLFAGFFIMAVSTILDSIGVTMGLWTYPAPLVPVMPEAIQFNVSVLPVVTMLFIQFFPRIKPVYKALIFGASGAFIFEELMEWAGLYCDLQWKHVYSFFILSLLYLLTSWIVSRKKYEPIDIIN